MSILTRYPSKQVQADVFGDEYEGIIRGVLDTMNSSSARIYGLTYASWSRWCIAEGVEALDLRPANVAQYLRYRQLARTSAARELAALRKLCRMAYILTGRDEFQRLALALNEMRAIGEGGQARSLRALSLSEASAMLAAWSGDDPRSIRNNAIITLLLCSGLRRAELAALRTDAVDMDAGIIQVVGKGDKRRDVPVVGGMALNAVRRWSQILSNGYEWFFPAIKRGGLIADDAPISGGDVYRIWNETSRRSGLSCSPHAARRTFITELLASGADPRNVQAIVGHARGDTTLRYAQAAQVRAIRDELMLRYA